jgi:hypothetical protein
VVVALKQINVRLDEDTLGVLEAAAFVKHTSLPELVRPHLEDIARRFRDELPVRTALRSRKEQEAADVAVEPIDHHNLAERGYG